LIHASSISKDADRAEYWFEQMRSKGMNFSKRANCRKAPTTIPSECHARHTHSSRALICMPCSCSHKMMQLSRHLTISCLCLCKDGGDSLEEPLFLFLLKLYIYVARECRI
jgi:hypothetical protein